MNKKKIEEEEEIKFEWLVDECKNMHVLYM